MDILNIHIRKTKHVCFGSKRLFFDLPATEYHVWTNNNCVTAGCMHSNRVFVWSIEHIFINYYFIDARTASPFK